MFKPADLFDLAQTEHAAIFADCKFAWDALKKIESYLAQVPRQNPPKRFPGASIGEKVFIGEGTVVEPGAMIKGPAIIGKNCQIRHNAYIRENVIIGDDCVVGNSSELKNSLLFNGAQAPHFNYIGDSILGHKAHLGAGVKISNVKLFAGNVMVNVQSPKSKVQSSEAGSALTTLDVGLETLDTGLRKFGALLGDGAEAGCNAVLNPGSILGRGAVIYPNVFWRGILPANMIAKNKSQIEVVVKRPREN
jgi:UDP-N-acetylglucosamine diphosphorylase / glucose-1-phosphate thymidylyltransferase / UDP-N-acetylgalactosamine diphosphorylase / glucosamine-1-phosphate N-acetyltransferase / galactosamine-1-phosphate N-acetyltransferase